MIVRFLHPDNPSLWLLFIFVAFVFAPHHSNKLMTVWLIFDKTDNKSDCSWYLSLSAISLFPFKDTLLVFFIPHILLPNVAKAFILW